MRIAFLLVFGLFFALAAPLLAQEDTITRNPACVRVKRIWKIEGKVVDDYLGDATGSVGDVNGDGLGDFAVMHEQPPQWMVFYGSADSIAVDPVWTMEGGSYEIRYPVVGDFWGTGHRAVGFARMIVDRTIEPYRIYDWLRIYRTDSNKLEAVPSAVWYAVNWKDTTLRVLFNDALAADLDGDGDDELIIAMRWVFGEGRYGHIWIYDGGPNFQVDTPSIVIKDPELNADFFHVYAGHFDRDKRIDLMTVSQTPNQQGNSYNFYWGTGKLPSNNMQPDRKLISPEFSKFLEWIDCDGDGVQDLVTPGILIWRSGGGKNLRTRQWNRADADIYLKSAGGQLNSGKQPGYLNSKRYEMVSGLWAPGQILFSGGPLGPDLKYEATYYPGADGLQSLIPVQGPVGDVNGDGWDDAIAGRGNDYPDRWTNTGIAIILAGGPYIPTDEPALAVRQFALENRQAALSLWPNPVRQELNIAWRGDLKRMPRHFEIHDMSGRLVSSGSVPDGDGAALWRCGNQPEGTYMLSIFDEAGELLASESVVKQQ